jgi:hypothetical protein
VDRPQLVVISVTQQEERVREMKSISLSSTFKTSLIFEEALNEKIKEHDVTFIYSLLPHASLTK